MMRLGFFQIILVLLCYFSLCADETFKTSGLDKEMFEKLKWKRLIDGFHGCEGAQWLSTDQDPKLLFAAHHDHLVFSWSASNGLSLFKAGSPEATSFRPGPQGGLYVVEQGTRRLAKWSEDGERMTVLASHYEGKKFNRPNDARIDHLGRVWFTDPDYLFRQRPHELKEQDGQYVYVFDEEKQTIDAAIKSIQLPNGIAISPDQKYLYIGESRGGKIYRFPFLKDGSLGEKELFYQCKKKRLDGLAFDRDGRLWLANFNKIVALDSSAKELVTIELPNQPTSMDFHKSGWICVTLRDSAYVAKL